MSPLPGFDIANLGGDAKSLVDNGVKSAEGVGKNAGGAIATTGKDIVEKAPDIAKQIGKVAGDTAKVIEAKIEDVGSYDWSQLPIARS
jgi:hypothetical protein